MEIYFFLIPVFIILFISIFIVNKLIKIDFSVVKYHEIDGLRGYLAFFVFLHHSYVWQVYLKTKEWKAPSNNLYNHFGETSVVFFFIITAFLFTSKLLNKTNPFNWNQYIISRFFRMFPMYIISVFIIFFIAFSLTNFKWQNNNDNFASILSWLAFTINGANDFNNFKNTYIINAGVTWTLPHEWMFYLFLPFLGLILKTKSSYKTLIIFGILFLLIVYFNGISIKHIYSFLGGILVAISVKKYNFKNILQTKLFSIIGILLLSLSVIFFNSGRNIIAILISIFVFLLIANGNNFFGMLSNNISRKFGQITYSLYLIHGIILFLTIYCLIGTENVSQFSKLNYWILICTLIFPIVLISQITYKYIELPMMNYMKNKK